MLSFLFFLPVRALQLKPPFTAFSKSQSSRRLSSLWSSGEAKKAVIIGGGPSGYFSAITIADKARQARYPVQVLILEASSKPLNKVLISGGGRCNLLPNTALDVRSDILQAYPEGRGRKELLSPMLSQISPGEILKWFNERGVETKVEADGRTFPITDDSRTVEQCLRKEAERLNVKLRVRTLVKAVEKDGESGEFTLRLKRKGAGDEGETTLKADILIMATGSSRSGYDLASSIGHDIVKPVPSLFTLSCEESNPGNILHGLAGVASQRVRMTIATNDKSADVGLVGPVLVTHVGLSGPVALKTSAYKARVLHELNYKAKIVLDWAPTFSTVGEVVLALTKYKATNGRRGIRTSTPHAISEAEVPKRLWVRIVDFAGVKEGKIWAEVSKKEISSISSLLKNFELKMVGKSTFKEEFVTSGGVSLKQLNMKSASSKTVPGLFFVGEMTNVDAITGGYNFLNCWTSGYCAGSAALDVLMDADGGGGSLR